MKKREDGLLRSYWVSRQLVLSSVCQSLSLPTPFSAFFLFICFLILCFALIWYFIMAPGSFPSPLTFCLVYINLLALMSNLFVQTISQMWASNRMRHKINIYRMESKRSTLTLLINRKWLIKQLTLLSVDTMYSTNCLTFLWTECLCLPGIHTPKS